jgi:GntR family transcriptional repressor for pyruvate dehydrogenase complex
MEWAPAIPDFIDADVQFHLRLADACGNSALRDIHSSVQALLRTWIARVVEASGDTRPSFAEHVPLLEAVADGDSEAARLAMAAHMSSAADRLRHTLEGVDGARGR